MWLYPVENDGSCPVWSDAWKIGRRGDAPFTGVEVDMHHSLVETVERVIREVVDLCDPDPMKQLTVGGILQGIPQRGRTLIANWQERAARYPDG